MLVADIDQTDESTLRTALESADVASVILAAARGQERESVRRAEKLVRVAQQADVAALIANHTGLAGRCAADGILLAPPDSGYRDIVPRFSRQMIVGLGGAMTRHRALELGEAEPDFLFFGKIGGDIRPDPHPKNLELAAWWSELVEIPGIVMGGNSIESIVACAQSGAEFAALGQAVFAHGNGAGEAVKIANRLLEENAPLFSDK